MNSRLTRFAYALLAMAAPAAQAQQWRSVTYPDTWTPGYAAPGTGHFVHDFSYAGWKAGAEQIPVVSSPTWASTIYNVKNAPYNAVGDGVADDTAAIQAAIDAAIAAGGGTIFLPPGTYRVRPSSNPNPTAVHNRAAISLHGSNLILKGAGSGQTFLFNDQTNMRLHSVISVSPAREAYWLTGSETSPRPLLAGVVNQSMSVQISDTSDLAVGDWVVVRGDNQAGSTYAADHGMTAFWTASNSRGPVFYRRITALSGNTATLDIPLRYRLPLSWNARLYKVPAHAAQIGVQGLSIGMRQNTTSGTGGTDYNTPGTGAYEMHQSRALWFNRVVNGFAHDVKSYRPPVNTSNIHVLSYGIFLDESRNVTLSQVQMQWPNYRGEGGNGYMLRIEGQESLIVDSIFNDSRHNFAFWQEGACGNVILRTTVRNGQLAADFHGFLSMANLLDSVTVDSDFLFSGNRGSVSGGAGHSSTECTAWNVVGKAYKGSSTNIIGFDQYGRGNIIGTSGPAADSQSSWSTSELLEGEFIGDRLVPQSLYEDQLLRRLGIAGQPPAAPGALSAVAASDVLIHLAWTDNATNETGQTIEVRTASGAWQILAIVDPNQTAFEATGLHASTTYTFRVFATNATGKSEASNEATATTQPTPTIPSSPSALSATPVSHTRINLAWQDDASNETSQVIESRAGAGPWNPLATVQPNITTYGVTGLQPFSEYSFRVSAANSAGTSDPSNVATATTLEVPLERSLYWDIDGTSPGATSGTSAAAAWDGANSFFNEDPDGAGGALISSPGLTDDLFFSAGTDATGGSIITITGVQSARSLTIEEGTVTFSGASSPELTLGEGGLTMLSGLPGNLTLGASLGSIIVAADQVWDNQSTGRELSILAGIAGQTASGTTFITFRSSSSVSTKISANITDSPVGGKVGLIIDHAGAGVVLSSMNRGYSGGTYILAGSVAAGNSTSSMNNDLGTGPIYLGDTNPLSNANTGISIAKDHNITNSVFVRGGNTGVATITVNSNPQGGRSAVTGGIFLGSAGEGHDLRLIGNAGSNANQTFTPVLTNKVTGVGSLSVETSGGSQSASTIMALGTANDFAGDLIVPTTNVGTVSVTASHAYTGRTRVEGGTLRISGANHRLPIGTELEINSPGNFNLNGNSQTVASLAGTGQVRNTSSSTTHRTLTVGPTTGSSFFSGRIGGDGTNENNVALTKIGGGTLVMSGTHTYTGDTSVTDGALALVGASLSSPITVQSSASLAFTLGSPSTSTAAVNLGDGTILITGTPVAPNDYTLLTTTAAITGDPVLAYPIPGYEPIVEGGNMLRLVYAASTSPYVLWAETHGLAGADAAFEFDYERDGLENGLEWILGGNPTANEGTPITPQPIVDTAGNFITTFSRTEATLGESLLYLEYGSDLLNWNPVLIDADGGFDAGVLIEIEQGVSPDQVTVTIPADLAPDGAIFVRLTAELIP